MSIMMLQCVLHQKEKEEEFARLSKQNDIMSRALKMPQTEFERVASALTKKSVVDYKAVSLFFGVSVEDVISRGEDLHIW